MNERQIASAVRANAINREAARLIDAGMPDYLAVGEAMKRVDADRRRAAERKARESRGDSNG